ncbi:MAG: Peptide methionine sulfoxide reductase MsrA [Nitrosopumilales archaeon]|nr:MAG: Peptide methionine sulfoxide reductase MsrA [Nitrosopumilales archaeon]
MAGIFLPEWHAFNLIISLMISMKATFAAGCFWHVEDLFRKVKGVSSATSGYTGGAMPNPSYQDVCTDRTGHAEAVQVEYDPKQVSYDELLKVFWENHNPTTLNRQGPDVGTQYRSAIFFHDAEQEKAAKESMKNLQESMPEKKVVTEITPAKEFFKAEEYHQRYFEKQGLI